MLPLPITALRYGRAQRRQNQAVMPQYRRAQGSETRGSFPDAAGIPALPDAVDFRAQLRHVVPGVFRQRQRSDISPIVANKLRRAEGQQALGIGAGILADRPGGVNRIVNPAPLREASPSGEMP